MAYSTGFVDNSGGTSAHYGMLAAIKTLAEANGWTTLRYDTVSANRELILQGVGLSTAEEIFVGFRTYQDAGADYYNLVAATFTGYVAGNTFDTQPGAKLSGVPAHNIRIDYWLVVNAQRIVLAMKVGTPVYETAYVGKFLPYTLPTQYPYPVVCCGMLTGTPATRYSDTTQSIPFKGNRANMQIRKIDGVYYNAYAWPWTSERIAEATRQLRETGTVYTLQPVVLHNNADTIYGELDGVFHISGFSQGVENTLVIGGVTYVVIQDVYRTSFNDFYALRLS